MKFFELNNISILTTGDCNLNCKYCYWVRNSEKIKVEHIDLIFKKLLPSRGKHKRIILVGGEPLLNETAIKRVIQNKKKFKGKNKLSLILDTNGLLLGMYPPDTLSEFDSIFISLDGSLKSNLKNRFKTKEQYREVISNITKIKSKGIRLGINKVITRDNVKDLYLDLMSLSKLGLPISVSIAMGNAKWKKEEYLIYKKEIQKICNSLIKNKKFLYNLKSLFNIPIPFCPFSNLTVDPNGDLYNCEILASFKKNRLTNIKNLKLENCNYKLYRKKCREESCLECDTICRAHKFDKTRENGSNLFDKVLGIKSTIPKSFIKENKIRIPTEINIINEIPFDEYKITKLINFLIGFYSFFFGETGLDNDRKIGINSKNKDLLNFIKKEIKKYKKLDEIEFYFNNNVKKEGFIFNFDSEKIFVHKKGLKRFIGYLNEEYINLIEVIK